MAEHRWLPYLSPQLALPIPVPVARGVPGAGYPFPWSVYRWLNGTPAAIERIANLRAFASTLGALLTAVQRIDAAGGPPPGLHRAFRGGSLLVYDVETRRAIDALKGRIDTGAATAVWEAALGAAWHGSAVWFHGDVAVGNVLVDDGRLCAVIDWGCAGVADPACDLVIAWTLFGGASRDAFRAAVEHNEATWARGRGWALWKALITVDGHADARAPEAAAARGIIDDVLAEQQHAR